MLKILAAVCLALTATGQQTNRVGHSRLPVEDGLFENCAAIEGIARSFDPGGADRAFSVELYPRTKGSNIFPFISDSGIRPALNWITATKPHTSPSAMFYSVDGRYHFYCRDAVGTVREASGVQGNPLELKLDGATASILHFDFYNKKMAHVYVVTKAPLGSVPGQDLLDRVTRMLDARFVFLYVRNDPWFYGYASDSSPYTFTDLSAAIDDEQYLKTQTISCMTGQGCRLGPSWH